MPRKAARLIALVFSPAPAAHEWAQILVAVLALVGVSLVGVKLSASAGAIAGLLVVVALVFVALWRTDSRVSQLIAKSPVLIADKPYIDSGPEGTGVTVGSWGRNPDGDGWFYVHYVASYLILPVRNSKPLGAIAGTTAEHTRATLTLRRLTDGLPIFGPHQACWAQKDEQLVRGPRSAQSPDVAEMNIPPNSRTYEINTILQDREEFGLRAWTQEGNRHPLLTEAMIVDVEIEPSNAAPKLFSFEVSPGQRGSPPVVGNLLQGFLDV